MPATLFINTKSVGEGMDMMDWKEVKDAMNNNVEIGNHTHSHRFFINLEAVARHKAFKEEIDLSQEIFFEKIKMKPVVFTYPYGEFDPEMKKIVMASGFKAAAAQNSGVVNEASDLFMCPRFPMSESYSSPEKFSEKAKMKALVISNVSPESFVASDKRPLLKLTIENQELRADQLRCYVQGGECDLKILDKKDQQITVTIQAKKSIAQRRRTLYTVTAPDKSGVWHWYSHVWINPSVKEE
jgi:peptidoglycan/xylan/chitin deacetylase (PgdA/CDA1 family)